MKEGILTSGGSIDDWRRSLIATGSQKGLDVAEGLYENRVEGFEALERLGLPRYKQIIFKPVEKFLQSPDDQSLPLLEAGVERFFAHLTDPAAQLPKQRQLGLSFDGVKGFIDEVIPSHAANKYTLVLGEYLDRQDYGGAIMVRPDGGVLFEMIEGNQTTLVLGKNSPQFRITRDIWTQVFRFEGFEDKEDLQKVATDTLLSIPKTFPGLYTDTELAFRSLRFLPGYYEFTLARKDDSPNSQLNTYFVDYNDNPNYYNFS